MCGIAGFVHDSRERTPCDDERLRLMTRTLQHRGPDGEGYFISGTVALGHRRLAVIDLNTGDQPMTTEDGSATIVFNGEIYNYLELRTELIRTGHRFRTSSDTEVVLAAYRQWGTECVKHFNGMWAFALWDTRQQLLFCSRDRAGEKPFFYSVLNGTFVFGSEIKALFAYGVPRSANLETLDAYLCFTYVPGRQTFFKNVYKLLPGHSLLVKNGVVQELCYWELHIADEPEARTDEATILEEFTALFENAVAIRMRSDVPLGAFLSGGLDSGSIVAVMSALSRTPITTFTIGFDNRELDERPLARLVAHRFATTHTERVVTEIDIGEVLSKLAWHFDEPFGDSSALPTYLISQIAREALTVVLTGDGGDEATSGYMIHLSEKVASLYGRLPSMISQSILPACASAARFAVNGTLKPKLLRLERVIHSSGMDFIDRLESKQNGFTRAERKQLLRYSAVRPARDYISDAIEPVKDKGNFTKLNYWLTKVALPDDMLCKVDRASMAHSLETRTPFLDYRLLELLGRTSMRVKMNGFQRKSILRKTFAQRLPAELLKAPKRGFTIPLQKWIQTGAVADLERQTLRSASTGLLCGATIRNILASHKSGNRDAAQAIWTLGMLTGHIA